MKCLVLLFISLGLAMSFPRPQDRDAEDLENKMTGMSVGLAKSQFHQKFESSTYAWRFLGANQIGFLLSRTDVVSFV